MYFSGSPSVAAGRNRKSPWKLKELSLTDAKRHSDPEKLATMQIRASNDLLTVERLVTSRWVWTNHTGKILTKSMYFGSNGNMKVYRTKNEHSWTLLDGSLRIFDDQAKPFWFFDVVIQVDDRLALIGRNPEHPAWWFSLTEYRNEAKFVAEDVDLAAEPAAQGSGDEGIRLVIWDLDETFWQGTLSEGGITPVQANIDIVETLNSRGIVNAICSKNNFDEAKDTLTRLGIWESFVFPEISFAPKGGMIKSIVKNAQLRPETILFIDDNPMNLNEALHYVPNLKTAAPDILPALLNDPRFAGKPDPNKSRLARYKILETKLAEKSGANGDNEAFLRNSDIRISFHENVEDEFPRIHDLVNRTNQLNFTKQRWPEDPVAARAQFQKELERFGTAASYIKVSDRFGSYGICGFFMKEHFQEHVSHFLFSCRALNMGVEQFVWQKIGRPKVHIKPPVVSDLEMDVDWIRLVDDADDTAEATSTLGMKTVCIRGACDLMVTSQYLRTKVKTIEEFDYAYHGWEIHSLPRIIALRDEIKRPENQAIIKKMPGLPVTRFESDIINGSADGYVISFSQESFCGYFRSRSTGMILPLRHSNINRRARVEAKPDYTKMPYDSVRQYVSAGTSQAQWDFIRDEFEFIGGFNPEIFAHDVHNVLTLLESRKKPVVILGLNDSIGRDTYILNFFKKVNGIVEPIVAGFGFSYIDVTKFVLGEDDLARDGDYGGPHYGRHIYARIAEEILGCLAVGKHAMPAIGKAA
jgi:FkbH-like protein